MRANPAKKPTRSMAFVATQLPAYLRHGQNGALLLLVDRDRKLDDAAIVGFLSLVRMSLHGETWYVSHLLAAARGYGPLMLMGAACLTGVDIVPSSEQTSHAQRLWSRQQSSVACDPAEFSQIFGISAAALLARGDGINPEKAAHAGWDFWSEHYNNSRILDDDEPGEPPPLTPWEIGNLPDWAQKKASMPTYAGYKP